MQQKWTLIEVEDKAVNKLKRELKLATVLCKLLVQRGVETAEDVESFFHPTLEQLHDPFLMKDMDTAVERLEKAVSGEEKILLFGDYDADGTAGVAMMYAFLEPLKAKLDYYIPNRYSEGYGLSEKGIEYAASNGHTLMIVVDCGIKANDLVAQAAEKGIDVIICDHHQPEETLPEAKAILNPKRPDCEYPYKELCGCGVAFKLIQAYAQKTGMELEEAANMLDFVAIATACDIVPMTGENRVLTRFGLSKLNDDPHPGIQAVRDTSRRSKPYSVVDVVFGIGPLINAAGRLAEGKEAVEMLVEKDLEKAMATAAKLREYNIERRKLEKDIAIQAERMVRMESESRRCLVLYRPEWHKGVLGIVASRMVERFHRPAIILTKAEDGRLTGSARSVGGYDIHKAIKSCADILENFGGHEYAAGLTMLDKNLDEFKARMDEVVTSTITKEQLTPTLKINALMRLKDITPDFWTKLNNFAPFGPQNMRPIFSSKTVRDTGFANIVGESHLSLGMKQGRSETQYGIGFGMAKHADKIRSKPFDICYVIEENNFKGKKTLRLNVKDIIIKR